MGLTHVAVKIRSFGSQKIHSTQTSSSIRAPWIQWLRPPNLGELGFNRLARDYMNLPAVNFWNMSTALPKSGLWMKSSQLDIIFGPENIEPSWV